MNLLKNKAKNDSKKQERKIVTKNLLNFLKVRKMILNGLKAKYF